MHTTYVAWRARIPTYKEAGRQGRLPLEETNTSHFVTRAVFHKSRASFHMSRGLFHKSRGLFHVSCAVSYVSCTYVAWRSCCNLWAQACTCMSHFPLTLRKTTYPERCLVISTSTVNLPPKQVYPRAVFLLRTVVYLGHFCSPSRPLGRLLA